MSEERSMAGPGWMARVAQTLRGRHAGAAAAPLDARLQAHAAKLCSAADAVAQIRHGEHVFVGTACATPRALVQALEARSPTPGDVELVHFLTDHAVPHDARGQAMTAFRHRCFFVGSDMRAAVRQGLAEYVPMSIARVPQLIANGRIRVDVALIQVSMPDAFGYVSLGVSVDIAPAAVAKARLVIAEVNPAMPCTMGRSMLHVDAIDWLVPVATPMIEYQHEALPGAVVEQIARYIGGIIEDGSTLQIGLGRVTNEALKFLADRHDLGIHSDVITDAIIPLLERGILNGRRKTDQRGQIVTSFAMGSRRLYDLIDRNPLFSFQPIEEVCRPSVIAAQHRMVSVTQAFAIDLTGQVCADQLDGAYYSGLAAQAEFLRGASRSPGGKPIICLPATDADGTGSRIRVQLRPGEGATIARSDVHYVVTEYGIAYLFGKSMRERAIALIEVAHPRLRPELFEQAQALGLLPAGQRLKNLRAYPLQDEETVVLGGGRQVLLRPSTASDAAGIRELFHSLSDQDVYTRFFRKLRALSDADVQRLCNLNFETEAGFVAATGPREDPQIVAQGCYFVDPSTNLAETAFIVSPAWQGCGLGKALQAHMVRDAMRRQVLGFVAEIMSSNDAMIRLAKGGRANVSVEQMGSTVRVTSLF
ncbi:MAG: GNAT family N-acetyltransferase [Burkholderiales bacterium]|nr:GNAT family N-acetyltransferase [Burkholderiales bacterium]MDE1928855.1 GNAT family N-acetyltransferase [Burkholderiales bacterium]MDE2159847.1 GNAT family N-acetyltransferase [Burkholderiales bacterium]MDE2505370.1 GNAT family N-acetyltransferase [Burkholderiales bacterium]